MHFVLRKPSKTVLKREKSDSGKSLPLCQKYEKLSKDQIDICKECEFRYICTDCRAYIEDPENIYSKPLKCGYDPATNQWQEWSENPLKHKTIGFYKLKDLFTTK